MCSRVSSLFQSAGLSLTRSTALGRTSGPAASTASSQTPFLTALALSFLAASKTADLILWGRSRASRALRSSSWTRFSAPTRRASAAAAATAGSFRRCFLASAFALRSAAAFSPTDHVKGKQSLSLRIDQATCKKEPTHFALAFALLPSPSLFLSPL